MTESTSCWCFMSFYLFFDAGSVQHIRSIVDAFHALHNESVSFMKTRRSLESSQ